MRFPRLASAVVGATLLIGVPYGWQLSQPPAAAGELRAGSTLVGWPDLTATMRLVTAGASKQAQAGPRPTPVSELRPAAPVRVRIAAIDVDATVVPVALEDDGAMELPDDVATVGWFEPGVRPGARGTAVLAGHVDSRTQGRGAFFDLRYLDVGDLITITDVNGAESAWQVAARRTYPKKELPIAELFTAAGDPRLVLITCGGAFDSEARSYTENVVVYATSYAPN